MGARTVGVVLFDRFELLDVFGPLEIFGVLKNHFEIVVIGPPDGYVASSQGPRSVVDVAYAGAPPCDVVLVPGGLGTRSLVDDGEFIGWLGDWASKAELVTSVCTGSGVLARAGLLDGYRATSNKRDFAFAVSQGPLVEWVPSARWVADRDRWTSSGVAAGMDMASIRRELPEEFWADFDSIIAILDSQIRSIVDRVAATARAVQDLPDKEVGLRLATFDDAVRSFIFMFRKSGGDLLSGRNREKVFRAIRPTNNELAGYVPSYAMNRVNDESG